MHYAVHGHTAAELIVERANAEKEHMGLTNWENAPDGKIVKPDVSIAKNYLNKLNLKIWGKLVQLCALTWQSVWQIDHITNDNGRLGQNV